MSLSTREIEMIVGAWKSLKTDPQIDYTQLAAHCGFKNPNSAAACWSPLKKKLEKLAAEKDGTEPAVKENASKGKKRKSGGSEVDGGQEKAKPSKKTKSSGNAIKEEPVDEAGADGDADVDAEVDSKADSKDEAEVSSAPAVKAEDEAEA